MRPFAYYPVQRPASPRPKCLAKSRSGCTGARLGIRTFELAKEVCGVELVPVFGELSISNTPDVNATHHDALSRRGETHQWLRERAHVRVSTDDRSFFERPHCNRIFTHDLRVRKCLKPLLEERQGAFGARFCGDERVVVDVVVTRKPRLVRRGRVG